MSEPLPRSGPDLAHSFSAPPESARPALEWRWNAAPDAHQLSFAIEQTRASGHGAAILRPAAGMGVAFPGPHWTALARAFLTECHAHGLRAYLGDDMGPSGTGGGTIPSERSDLTGHFLRVYTDDLPVGALTDYHPLTDEMIVSAIAAPLDMERRPDFTGAVSLLSLSAARDVAHLMGACSAVRVYRFNAERDGYVDILNPTTAALFLRRVHDQFRRDLGLDYSLLDGFWSRGITLQPQVDGEVFPWSPVLPEAFSRAHGYDLREWLPALVANTGHEAVRLRQEFWEGIAGLAQISFWDTIGEWMRTRKLEWYGTFEGAWALNDSIAQAGDPIAAHRALSAPGVRVTAPNGADASEASGQWDGLGARLAASVAALQGSKRVIAELGDGLSWGATLSERTQTLHHLLCRGANSFLLGSCTVSLRREPDTENSPSEAHQPYWEAWEAWADYAARCGHALSQGQSGANVGLLWPTRSAQAHFFPGGHRYTRWVEEDLTATARLLERTHYDYLILPEDDLNAAHIQGAALLCGTARVPIELLVLPSVTALSRDAWRKIEDWISMGGKVVCLGLLPRWSERGRDPELETTIEALARVNIADIYDSYSQLERTGGLPSTVGYPITREEASGGRFCCYQPRLNADEDDALLRARKLLRESLPARAETQTPGLLISSRILPNAAPANGEEFDPDERFAPGGDLFWIYNEGDEAQRANLLLRPSRDKRQHVPHELDGWTGELALRPVFTPYSEEEGGGLSLSLELAAGEAKLLWLRPLARSDSEAYIERATFRVESWNGAVASGYTLESGIPRIAVRLPDGGLRRHSAEAVQVPSPILLDSAWETIRRSPNVLPMGEWQWTRSRGGSRAFTGEIGREGWQPLPPRESPNGRLAAEAETQLAANGAITLRTTFQMTGRPASLWLCVDAPDAPHTFFLNGQPLEAGDNPFEDQPLWREAGWTWYDLSGTVGGENTLLCSVEWKPDAHPAHLLSSLHLVPGVARLLGDFSIGAGNSIEPASVLQLGEGSWHGQGLPFYSGAVDYKQWVNVPTRWNNCRVHLELSRMRDACGLWLNGRSCGVRVGAPYRFDVSKLVLRGSSNELRLRVWNTAEAALEGHARSPLPSGLLGGVRLVAYPVVHPTAE